MTVTEEVIGHGTWYDKMAVEVVERERKLGRDLGLVRVESGVAASGIPHIGSLAEVTRNHAVALAIQEQGYNSDFIVFSDDKDGLRSVPAGLPRQLNKYLGYPVRDIPDPFGCHGSFGEHMVSLLLEAIEACGIQYTFMSGAEVYERDFLKNEIEILLENAQRVGEIVREETGQEKYLEALPYFPVCAQCGRIYTTRAYKFLPKEEKVLYACEGMEVKGRWLEGCGHRGEADYTRGEGKLSWKAGEFAARWRALGVRFEGYGKDIADSVKVNDRISREVLGYEPPLHVQYEMFLDKSGRKISKSLGNVFTPQVWLRYGSSQSLMLLTLKRFVGTRHLSVTDIPQYMGEFDELEDIYFRKGRVPDEKEWAKLTGLYMYCQNLKPPAKPSVHAPYNFLVYLTKVAPKGREDEYVAEKLRAYGYLKGEVPPDLKRRMGYALHWVEDFEEITEKTVELTDREASAIQELIQALQDETDEEKIQGAVFTTARKHAVPPKKLFQTLYTILLGTQEGPRLGPYIVAMGRKNVIEALERALRKRQ